MHGYLRIMIFIDASAMRKAFEEAGLSPDIDLNTLQNRATNVPLPVRGYNASDRDRICVRTYYYEGEFPREDSEKFNQQQAVLNRISELRGFEVRTGHAVRAGNGRYRQKGVDVRLATDMVAMGLKDLYDIAVLVAGDRDFVGAVEEVKRAGKQVMLAYPADRFCNKSLSADLKRACDGMIELISHENHKDGSLKPCYRSLSPAAAGFWGLEP